jgi:hypothetical protein
MRTNLDAEAAALMGAIAKVQCEYCSKALPDKDRGAHKNSAPTGADKHTGKSARRPKIALRYRPGRVKPKSASGAIEVPRESKPKNLSPKTSPLRCERVNDSTFKITNGELINVPGTHGKWAGYRQSKAVDWIIKLESDAWLARCGHQVCGPCSFAEAKTNAIAMAKGAHGDYVVRSPISHLNGLQARLLDTDESSGDD